MTLSDPACGSEGMLLEVICNFRELGFNPHTQLWIDANDVSHITVYIYIQFVSAWNGSRNQPAEYHHSTKFPHLSHCLLLGKLA